MAMTGGTAKCVKTTYPFSDSSKAVKLYVYYKTVQDTEANKSTITCGMYVTTPHGWDIGPWGDYGGSYIGKTSLTFNGGIANFSGEKWLAQDKSFTVSHNSDGTGQATIYWKWGVRSTWGGFYEASGSFTITLPTIPRSSSITSASNIELGKACNIKWTPANSSFKYKINFKLGDWSYTTDFIEPKQTSAYTYTGYTISGTTTANSTTIYKQLPTQTSGTMTATLTTYNSNKTKIGSTSSKTFTVTIPGTVKPSINSITFNPHNITTVDGTSRDILVQAKNNTNVEATGCSPGTGSSIKSYKFDVLSGSTVIATKTVASSADTQLVTFNPFSTTGVLTFKVTVTDSRGRSNSKTTESDLTCHSYVSPSFSSFKAYRCDSNGDADDNGTYIKYDFEVSYSSVNNTNKSTVNIYYKKNTATSWTQAKAALTNSTKKSAEAIIQNTNSANVTFDAATTYNVYASVTDNYNGTRKSSSATIFGASRIFNVRPNGSGIAFGKMAESNNLFECRWAAKFDSGLTVGTSSQTSAPTSGITIHDVRSVDITPDSFGDKNANFYFDQVDGRWSSVLHMKGWKNDSSSNYAAWELAGNASTSSLDNTLKYRQGVGSTWGDWQSVITNKTINSYALPKSGGALTGKLTLPTDLYYASNDTAGLDCNNSDIINANGIYFKDAVDSAGEGINFYRGTDKWDRLYSYSGTLYYTPNAGTKDNHPGTRYTVYHSGIACTELYRGSLTSGSATFNYGNYKAYVIVGQASSNTARISAYIPKNVLTTIATRYQIADETYYCSFNLSYSGSTATLSYYGSNGSGKILYVYGIN